MFKKQIEAYKKFKKLKVGALFMEMGTGKTKVALELVNYNDVDLLIYIAPFSTLNNIKEEFKKWDFKKNYKLIGYETIQASNKKYLNLLNEIANKKCFIIADESIFIKNEETKRYKRLIEIRKKCEYALILNGTPITKNEWDIYNQMNFLSPLIINMSRLEFLNTFFKKITYKKIGEKENTFYKFSEINADYLYELIKPYIFKASLDFEKKEETNTTYIDYNLEEYKNVKNSYLTQIRANNKSDIILKMLQKLNFIASCHTNKNEEVIKYIKNKKVIVYCNYLQEVEYISSKVESYVITGSVKNRKEIIEKFKNDNKPLIMTFGTGSYSLNMQFCNEIVYSSISFDYGLLEQSKHRIKRIGQKEDIKYTYFLTDLGITKLILENLDKKKMLKDLIKEKIENGGVEEWVKNI